MLASTAEADTRLFPIISISEQYDSNVFYAPKSLLAPGTKADDFVTFVNPQLIVTHTSSALTGSFTVGGVVGKYVNNSELDFAGVNAAATINMTDTARRISNRFNNFTVMGAYQFTPAASAFGGGGVGFSGVGFSTGGGSGGGVVGPFDSGLVANRVRISSYTAGVSGGYTLTPSTQAQFGYMYNQIVFGGQFGLASSALQNQLFDTTSHTVNLGTTTQVSRVNTIGMNYSYSRFDQGIDSFVMHTGAGSWSRLWTREIQTAISGGATLLEPFTDRTAATPRRIPMTVQPVASAVLSWNSVSSTLRGATGEAGVLGGRMSASPMLMSTMQRAAGGIGSLPAQSGSMSAGGILPRGRYMVALSYNFGVFPSYVAESGPMVTHVVGVTSSFGLTDRVTGQVGVNFARSIGSFQNVTFATDSYSTTAALNYLVTPNLQVSLTHGWLNFIDQSPIPALVNQGNQVFDFSKHTVMFTLGYVFTPTQGFFRSGGIGDGRSGVGLSGSPVSGASSSEKGIK